MKERVVDFNQIVREYLAGKFPLEKISPLDNLNSFPILTIAGYVRGESCLFRSDSRIGKLAFSSITLNGIINTTLGIACSESCYDIPVLIFEKTELPRIITFTYIDFIPLSKTSEYQEKYIEPLKPISKDLAYIPGRNNSFRESLGSPYSFSGFFKRHHKFSVGVALERYLGLWVNFLENAMPINSPEYDKEIKSNRQKLANEFSFSENSNKFLDLMLGKYFTKRLLKEIFL